MRGMAHRRLDGPTRLRLRGPTLAVALVATLALGGCAARGGSGEPTPTAASVPSPISTAPQASVAPSAAPTATEAPAATKTTTGTLPASLARTFAARIDPSVVAAPDEAGEWFLTLSSTDGYGFGRVATGLVENPGNLSVAGDRLTFSGESGSGACGPLGSYTWSISDGTLRLAVVADDCAVRVNQYVHQPWIPCPGDPTTCAAVLK